ncbi:unnamed protein product [Mytilus coruscus]|uniref:Ig-like domain-containing protein n=1 Tax=Mytilus coruscus TaxID=42192 RepID=A0A6J8DBB6_MYTCO|nr:unnamed protein product [Mytilus coruscus]
MWFKLMILVHLCAGFPLKCPEPAQWALRANGHCADPSKYFCLKDDLDFINGYTENCTKFGFQQPGRKAVLRLGIDADICSKERYQPFPIRFYTNASTNCIFLKSFCNEEGQVVYDHGNRNSDATCKCDYRQGYDFLVRPNTPCFCKPSQEDCSCYLKICSNSSHILSPDYKCIFKTDLTPVPQCRAITDENNINNDNGRRPDITGNKKHNISVIVPWKKRSAIVVLSIFGGTIIVILLVLFIRRLWRYCFRDLQNKGPGPELCLIEGDSLILQYMLPIKRLRLCFFKNNKYISETVNAEENVFRIENVTLTDEGNYFAQVFNIRSRITKVTVQSMFTSEFNPINCIEGEKLQLKCSVYSEDIHVEWFKDHKKMEQNENISIGNDGMHHCMIFQHAKLSDAGQYFMVAGNVRKQLTVTIKVLPEAINLLQEKEKARYIELMQSSEVEKRYFVRIMVVGKEFVGKTCLVRRLLMEGIDDVSSTDGVDIVVHRCKIDLDDGKWMIDKYTSDDKVDRISRALKTVQNESIKKEVSKKNRLTEILDEQSDTSTGMKSNYKLIQVEVHATNQNHMSNTSNLSQSETSTPIVNKMSSNATGEGNISGLDNASMSTKGTKDNDEIILNTDKMDSMEENENGTSTDLKEIFVENKDCFTNKSYSLVMPSDLMARVFSTTSASNIPSNNYALCGIWDFAGQKDFYATHQAFLTNSAIYLVVADMDDDIVKQDVKQFNADFQHVGEYVDFWFDAIHCHRTVEPPVNESNDYIDPPVILVLTGKDKYEKENIGENKIEERKTELQFQLDMVLGNQSKYHHLREIICLSNKTDKDVEFVELQQKISTIMMGMEKWGQTLPLKWILLEYLIEINKNDGKNFINLSDMANLAKHNDINILDIDHVKLFLRFQHEVGNIIYFEDIQDFIILNPKWLVDAFRCLVSDRIDGKLQHRTDWTKLARNGEISKSLITELFRKCGNQFLDQIENLLKVMEKFDILVKIGKTHSYIMPSMMPSVSFDEICKQIGVEQPNCKRTSWLCLKFAFLPPTFFNHVSVWFIRKYEPTKLDNEIHPLALFRGICVFDIDKFGCEILMVTMSTNVIAIQLLSFSTGETELGSICCSIHEDLIEKIEAIEDRYKLTIFYELHFKCSTGHYFKDTMSYKDLKSSKEYHCKQHRGVHQSKEIYLPWMKNEKVVGRQRTNNWNLSTEPWNRRGQIEIILEAWKISNCTFVETRAVKHVLECVQENSCLTITGNSGVGKTATLRHVALKMADKGYDIIPVTNPLDIVLFYNPNQKTLFVVDDFCGTYYINQSELNKWEEVIERIKPLIQNKLTNIIVACRLQVYQDEKFESLSIFRTCVCNLLSDDLCLSKIEKQSIAELYLDSNSAEIIQYCDLYDCFPLLCKFYNDNPELNITDFFKNPFSAYEAEIDKLNKKGHFGKYCALALCVIFNNRLEEKWLTDEIDTELGIKIQNTCEACKLHRKTSRLVLLDELESLEKNFIKKEHGLYKIIHDKLFDFLVYFFGQRMIQCLITNAESLIIGQRFLLDRNDGMDQFITVIPPKYHEMYLKRMMHDLSEGRVLHVFNNINMKIPEFRMRFLCYINTFDIPSQIKLALTRDVDCKETVLLQCCQYDYLPLIQWCINHGVDVNQCNFYDASPLYESAQKGYIETVKLLLHNKADINKCTYDGASPLCIACQMNHIEIVKLLLDNNAETNKCRYDGRSPLYIACCYNHIETIKILLDNKADVNKCTDTGESPLSVACLNNHKEAVKISLDYKADINKCTDNGASPLFIACLMNHTEIIKVLLENKADINKSVDGGSFPLFMACVRNQLTIVKLLLENKADINKCIDSEVSPLCIACQKNHIEIVKVLLENKADINKGTNDGASPLYIACQSNGVEIVKVLLDNKADINKCTKYEVSPLLIACKMNHIEIVKVLLQNKADINKCDDNGTSLFIACQMNHIEICKLLLDNKADINKCADDGASPLYIAYEQNHTDIVRMLVKNGADDTKASMFYHRFGTDHE